MHLVRSLLDEVFGSQNFVGEIAFKKTRYQSSALLPANFDYLLWHGRDRDRLKDQQLYVSKLETAAFVGHDLWADFPMGERRRLSGPEAEALLSAPGAARVFRHKLAESSGASSAWIVAISRMRRLTLIVPPEAGG